MNAIFGAGSRNFYTACSRSNPATVNITSTNETGCGLVSTADKKESLVSKIYMLFASLCTHSVAHMCTACKNLEVPDWEISPDFHFLSFLSSDEAIALTNIVTALKDKTPKILNQKTGDTRHKDHEVAVYSASFGEEVSFAIVAIKGAIYLKDYAGKGSSELTKLMLISFEQFVKANSNCVAEGTHHNRGATLVTANIAKRAAFTDTKANEYIFNSVSGVLQALRSESLKDVYSMCTNLDDKIHPELKLNSNLNWIGGLSKNELLAVTEVVEALKNSTSLILDQKRIGKRHASQEVTVYEYSVVSSNDASFSVVALGGEIYLKNHSDGSLVNFISFEQFVRASCAPDADFSGLYLKGINLSNKDLSRINFIGSDLKGANFSGTILYRTILNCADARGAMFMGAKMNYTTGLHNTKLQRASLIGIDRKNYKCNTTAIIDATTIRDSKKPN